MSLPTELPDFLPGRLILARGRPADYAALEAFHYIRKRPATWADVWTIRYIDGSRAQRWPREPRADAAEQLPQRGLPHALGDELQPAAALEDRGAAEQDRIVAIGVLSHPVPSCRAREQFFGLPHNARRQNLVFVNANLRTISRVIVHPQFRALGLSSRLVRCLCDHCKTRYVEAMAQMARAHPFFERAGMHRVQICAGRNCDRRGARAERDEPVYYIFDRLSRQACRSELSSMRTVRPLAQEVTP